MDRREAACAPKGKGVLATIQTVIQDTEARVNPQPVKLFGLPFPRLFQPKPLKRKRQLRRATRCLKSAFKCFVYPFRCVLQAFAAETEDSVKTKRAGIGKLKEEKAKQELRAQPGSTVRFPGSQESDKTWFHRVFLLHNESTLTSVREHLKCHEAGSRLREAMTLMETNLWVRPRSSFVAEKLQGLSVL
ncbi:unnamed protein product [Symbiodinium natans]|uniref:Uncharacterized protein n=1 Tax=Symbiodinium natans TaxID=878477 RepID=A0A812J3S3_9DINO|nr:unnamed protein product [Symbiodinium natans]